MLFEQFDIVKIKSTRRIEFLSGPPGNPISPLGEWSIVAVIEGDLLLAKNKTIVRIPVEDVTKIGRYDYKGYLDKIKKAGMPDPPQIKEAGNGKEE